MKGIDPVVSKPTQHIETLTSCHPHLKTGWQVGALQRETRERHWKYRVLVTVLAELENRHLHVPLI